MTTPIPAETRARLRELVANPTPVEELTLAAISALPALLDAADRLAEVEFARDEAIRLHGMLAAELAKLSRLVAAVKNLRAVSAPGSRQPGEAVERALQAVLDAALAELGKE